MRRIKLNPMPAGPSNADRVYSGLYGSPQLPAGGNALVPTSPSDVLDPEVGAERNSILLARLLRAEAGKPQHSRFGDMVV